MSSAQCKPAVFLIVTVSLPILRYRFSASVEQIFQNALASALDENPGYLVISGIVGDSNTLVTSRIATVNAGKAATLVQNLNWDTVSKKLALLGFPNCTLAAVQLTACLPGFELLESQTCQLCPAGYFCVGGSSGSTPCSSGYFALPGANSSTSCKPAVFVLVVISLPILASNFTSALQAKLQSAFAIAAGVPMESILVVANQGSQGRRLETSNAYTLVTAQIAVKDNGVAASISSDLNQALLNSIFASEGIPDCSLQSVTTTAPSPVVNVGITWPIIVGACVGTCVLVMICSVAFFILRRVESDEERELRLTVENLRVRLHITSTEGYVLRHVQEMSSMFLSLILLIDFCRFSVFSSEISSVLPTVFKHCWPWVTDKNRVLIPRSYLEAAGRLHLMQVRMLLYLGDCC